MPERRVLITGCSSGIGRAAALTFHEAGWKVVATVRHLAMAGDFPRDGITVVEMEMTDPVSIQTAVEQSIQSYGGIEVIINNAGFGLFGFFEEASDADLRRQIDTNLIGPILAIRAILPHFRARQGGLIINVSSLAAFVGPPLNSYYAASKWGLEGLSESLAAELKPFGIRCKLVEPGLTITNIHGNQTGQTPRRIEAYDAIRERIFAAITPDSKAHGFPAEMIAAEILRAVLDDGVQMRYPASPDASAVFNLRDELGSEKFVAAMRQRFPT